MREVDELLRRRPGLEGLAGEAQALRARLSEERGPSAPGASSLSRRRNGSTASWVPLPVARRSPRPASWDSWRA